MGTGLLDREHALGISEGGVVGTLEIQFLFHAEGDEHIFSARELADGIFLVSREGTGICFVNDGLDEFCIRGKAVCVFLGKEGEVIQAAEALYANDGVASGKAQILDGGDARQGEFALGDEVDDGRRAISMTVRGEAGDNVAVLLTSAAEAGNLLRGRNTGLDTNLLLSS